MGAASKIKMCSYYWPTGNSNSHGNVSPTPTQLYLNPQSMPNNSPKTIIIAIKAIILHTCGVQL